MILFFAYLLTGFVITVIFLVVKKRNAQWFAGEFDEADGICFLVALMVAWPVFAIMGIVASMVMLAMKTSELFTKK